MAVQSSGGGNTRVCLVHSQTLLETAEENPRFSGRVRETAWHQPRMVVQCKDLLYSYSRALSMFLCREGWCTF